jgi:hypothetical protein
VQLQHQRRPNCSYCDSNKCPLLHLLDGTTRCFETTYGQFVLYISVRLQETPPKTPACLESYLRAHKLPRAPFCQGRVAMNARCVFPIQPHILICDCSHICTNCTSHSLVSMGLYRIFVRHPLMSVHTFISVFTFSSHRRRTLQPVSHFPFMSLPRCVPV